MPLRCVLWDHVLDIDARCKTQINRLTFIAFHFAGSGPSSTCPAAPVIPATPRRCPRLRPPAQQPSARRRRLRRPPGAAGRHLWCPSDATSRRLRRQAGKPAAAATATAASGVPHHARPDACEGVNAAHCVKQNGSMQSECATLLCSSMPALWCSSGEHGCHRSNLTQVGVPPSSVRSQGLPICVDQGVG